MIRIIDYGLGNSGSIYNMLKWLGCREMEITSDQSKINSADKLILPGVGHFGKAMTNLFDLGLIPILNKKVLLDNTPLMGICLGMQLLFEKSEEGDCEGLGWIKGKIIKFDKSKVKTSKNIPHMGWNTVDIIKNDRIVNNLKSESKFYFVHSFHAICKDRENQLMKTNYMYDFTSAVVSNNIYGFQFHPEKSHRYGKKIFANFLKI